MDSDLACISIVDDDAATCEQLAALAHEIGWQTRCYSNAGEFLREPRRLKPGCLILDVDLPDMNGLVLQRQLSSRSELPIIFCTRSRDLSIVVQAMKAGALELLSKPICPQEMLIAIELAVHQSRLALAKHMNLQPIQTCYSHLSRREREVMALVVAGRLNKVVGHELGISEITVKAHRGKVMRKMGARSIVDLVRMATLLTSTMERPVSRFSLQNSPDYASLPSPAFKTRHSMASAHA